MPRAVQRWGQPMKPNIVAAILAFLALLGSFYAGTLTGREASDDARLSLLRLHAITQAREIQTAAGALSMMSQGNHDGARTLLESQARSALHFLRVVLPRLNVPLAKDEKQLVTEAQTRGSELEKAWLNE